MSEMNVSPPTQKYHYTKDLSSITNTLKVMLWVFLVINIIAIFSEFMQLSLLSKDFFSLEEAKANDIRQGIVGLIWMIVFIITAIIFLKWKYRANLNCHGFGAQDMKFKPGWAIGYYFIPILSFFKPYQAMEEIWKVSTNPANWQNEKGSRLIILWWSLWLICSFLGQLSLRASLGSAKTIESLENATIISIMVYIGEILLCIVTISLVKAIFTKQENLIKKSIK